MNFFEMSKFIERIKEREDLLLQKRIEDALAKYEEALDESVDDAELYSKIAKTVGACHATRHQSPKIFGKCTKKSPPRQQILAGIFFVYYLR